jgi:alpha-beta hydrolase superfamily lysophospholipase
MRLDLDSKVQIRKDIKSWISSQKLSPKLQNQITNLAISDEFLILNSKDDKAVQKSSKENSQRISCMIKEAKSPKEREKVLHLISEMRQRTFNSRSRANSYNEFQRKSAQNQLTVDQSESELNLHCKEYSEKIMNITF